MLPAGVHIGTQAFAVAGTNEWFLTWIKDAECDPVVEIMSRVFTRGTRLVVSSISNLGHSELVGVAFFFSSSGAGERKLRPPALSRFGFKVRGSENDEPSLKRKISAAQGQIKPTQG